MPQHWPQRQGNTSVFFVVEEPGEKREGEYMMTEDPNTVWTLGVLIISALRHLISLNTASPNPAFKMLPVNHPIERVVFHS